LRRPWASVVKAMPRPVVQALRVPAHAGDSDGICSNWDESQASPFVISNDRGWEGVSGLRFQATPVEVRFPSNMLGVIAAMLYRLKDGRTQSLLEVTSSSPGSPRLGRDYEYRLVSKAFYGPWTDFGSWHSPRRAVQ
jgi:hypothetical protein